jgi:hypothetical protein
MTLHSRFGLPLPISDGCASKELQLDNMQDQNLGIASISIQVGLHSYGSCPLCALLFSRLPECRRLEPQSQIYTELVACVYLEPHGPSQQTYIRDRNGRKCGSFRPVRLNAYLYCVSQTNQIRSLKISFPPVPIPTNLDALITKRFIPGYQTASNIMGQHAILEISQLVGIDCQSTSH